MKVKVRIQIKEANKEERAWLQGIIDTLRKMGLPVKVDDREKK
jgi:hypothetical protein